MHSHNPPANAVLTSLQPFGNPSLNTLYHRVKEEGCETDKGSDSAWITHWLRDRRRRRRRHSGSKTNLQILLNSCLVQEAHEPSFNVHVLSYTHYKCSPSRYKEECTGSQQTVFFDKYTKKVCLPLNSAIKVPRCWLKWERSCLNCVHTTSRSKAISRHESNLAFEHGLGTYAEHLSPSATPNQVCGQSLIDEWQWILDEMNINAFCLWP